MEGNDLVQKRLQPFSPERHRRQTQSRLVAGGLLILLVAGGGLVWLLYGWQAAIAAVACLLAVSSILVVLWLILTLLERWLKDEDA